MDAGRVARGLTTPYSGPMSSEAFVILGAGRVGRAIASRVRALDLPVALVTRTDGWSAIEDGPIGEPILMTVRADDIPAAAARVPERRRNDLVVVSNGAIREMLRDNGLSQCTRGVLYLAAADDGTLVPGGDSPFCGDHALPIARLLQAAGIPTRVTNWATFSYFEAEKLLWVTVFGLLSEKYGETVGVVAETRRDELSALVIELLPVLRATIGIDTPSGPLIDRLCLYASKIPSWKAGVREGRWRDGWFETQARRFRKDLPLHRAALAATGHEDLVAP
jgi:hypothetical protein